jgi:hypothetical protein
MPEMRLDSPGCDVETVTGLPNNPRSLAEIHVALSIVFWDALASGGC